MQLVTKEGVTGFGLYSSRYNQFQEPEALVSVRQVPPNRRSVTGLMPSRKNGRMVPFESALESDLATLLEFDSAVKSFDAQPIELRYTHDGRSRRGVPDFLVFYLDELNRRPLLIDVKYRREVFERWSELKPRLRAASAHARKAGWDYHIFTEVEIRTPYLENARLLLPYQRCIPDPVHKRQLLDALRAMPAASPQSLLEVCCADIWNRAQLIPTLWSLVGRGHVGADLSKRLTMSSVIWLQV